MNDSILIMVTVAIITVITFIIIKASLLLSLPTNTTILLTKLHTRR